MDNLTHSIIGLIAGESVAPDAQARRKLYLVIGAVGSNLPDIDLLWSMRGAGSGKLGYLLDHRGYMHTLIGCAALALLLYLAVEVFLHWRKERPSAPQRWAMAGPCGFAVLLHLGMDALNSYGVHPFWPLDNHWRYGDAVFIVEPLYWAAAAPLWMAWPSRRGRVFIGLLLLLAVLAGPLSGMALVASSLLLALLIVILLFAAAQATRRRAAWLSVAACVAITCLFTAAGRVAALRVDAAARAAPDAPHLLDHVLTPAPANPLCWDVLLLQADAQFYRIRHGRLSLAPSLLPAAACPRLGGEAHTTLAYTRATLASTRALQWEGEYAMARAQLTQVAAAHCQARALLHFARAPFIVAWHEGWMIGDARYDREPGLGFAEIALPPAADTVSRPPCLDNAEWNPPREDLLRP